MPGRAPLQKRPLSQDTRLASQAKQGPSIPAMHPRCAPAVHPPLPCKPRPMAATNRNQPERLKPVSATLAACDVHVQAPPQLGDATNRTESTITCDDRCNALRSNTRHSFSVTEKIPQPLARLLSAARVGKARCPTRKRSCALLCTSRQSIPLTPCHCTTRLSRESACSFHAHRVFSRLCLSIPFCMPASHWPKNCLPVMQVHL